jgi:tetratricopeptide (TPR) repeat protein
LEPAAEISVESPVARPTDDFAAAMQAARAAAAAPTIPPVGFGRGVAAEAAEVPAEVAPPQVFAEPKKAAAAVAASGDMLGAFVSDLEQALPVDFGVVAPPSPAPTIAVTPGAAAAAPAPVVESKPLVEAVTAAAETPASAEASLLEDMFAEFKEEAESGQQAGEDPETHYNLGVAFREMALLDEAIGELQKVSGAIDKGAPFRDVMQVYTLLAQCFVDKGVPEASVKWYEKALTVPCDQEQRLALHYELAAAYEAGGNKTAALQHFMEVYGSNIDYRDVAGRIKALRT